MSLRKMNTPRVRVIDLFIYTLLFTAVVSFPFSRLPIPMWGQYLIRILLSLALLVSYIFLIRRYQIPIIGRENKKNLLLLLPTIIVIPCNLLTLPFASSISFNNASITNGFFFFELILLILQALNEEIIFRLLIHSDLPIRNRLLKIVASSAIFAAFHLLNLINGFNVQIFIQVAYTFGLGMILGFIYEYGESIISCFIFHILFNFFNNLLFGYYIVPTINNAIYYSIIAAVSGVLIIYLSIIYFIKFKKQEDEYIYC